ncbi:MAG TPA: sigma 54-interacting transcriptional regulator, partial [Albitalea sp.]
LPSDAPSDAPRDAPSDAPSDALSALDTGDAAMQAAISRARRVLDKPIALLLQGESGTGKDLLARAVHDSSARRGGPFVAVNCAALPETLIEAELFGYRAGAFTGAQREGAPGRLREAHGGTLFLDEIGDMPLALQGRLLRVLQEREVIPLGGGKPVAVDFQLVCATHRQLRQEMEAGRFREDLYYRLNGLVLQLPPLRERRDMPQLIARMLSQMQPGRELVLAPELAQAMARHRWPGNLRQLNNALRTACALLDEAETQIDWPHLSDDIAEQLRAGSAPREPIDEIADLRAQSQRTIRQIVDACEGNLSDAARRLGISRNTLYRKLKEAGLRSPGG